MGIRTPGRLLTPSVQTRLSAKIPSVMNPSLIHIHTANAKQDDIKRRRRFF